MQPRSVVRMCRRPDCQGSATATLSYRYDTAEAILYDLVAEPHPSRWDLCTVHADTLRVPRGWNHLDERSVPGAPNGATASAKPNRYAELSARLPEIASDADASTGERPSPRTHQEVPGGQEVPDGQEMIPGQMAMPLHDVDLRADAAVSESHHDGPAYPGNVVPLLRRGAALDPVT